MSMAFIFMLLILIFSFDLDAAQTNSYKNSQVIPGEVYVLSGRVIDNETKDPVQDVTVGIEELKIFGYSDRDGRFVFENIKPEWYSLHISHPAYGEKIIEIRLKRNFNIEVELEKIVYRLNKVDNYYYRQSDRIGAQTITGENIKELPLRGIGDSLHLLQTLPGIGGGFSLATVPIIRGGNPLYDRLYIDDFPVDFPYHYLASIIPIMSSVNEEIVESASVIKGVSPFNYDDNLGNVFEIKTKNPDDMGFFSKILIDPVTPTFVASAIPTKKFNLIFAGRRSYVDKISDFEETNIYIQDHFLKMVYNLFSNHRLSLYAFGVDDSISLDEFSTRSRYNIKGLKWEFYINNNMFLKTLVSTYELEHYLRNDKVYDDRIGVYLKFNPSQFRFFQQLNIALEYFYFKTGYEVVKHQDGIQGNITLNDIPDFDILENTSLEISREYPISGTTYLLFSEMGAEFEPLWINIGIKYKHYGPLSNNSFSYRGKCGLNLTRDNVVYIGGGVYVAHPDMYFYLGESDPDFKDCRAVNAVAGVKTNFLSIFTGQLEFYYYKYQDITSAGIDIVNNSEYKKLTQINPFSIEEYGTSQGVEFFLKATKGIFYGWISYAYSVSKRSSSRYDMYDYYSDFDQTHIFRLVTASRFGSWMPSVIWNYYTSLPYTPITGSTEENGSYEPIYGDYNSERYVAHNRLDAKLIYITKSQNRFYVEAWNILLNKNNFLFQSYDTNKPFSAENPEVQSDIPQFFVWLGMEICF